MSDTLNVEARQGKGSRFSRKLRAEGQLPAVLYGHGEDPVNLVVRAEQLRGVLRHGGRVVDLQGAADGQALVQDTQWDTFGSHLMHLDLLRVDAKEMLQVEVPVELKGEAAGQNEGGIVEHSVRAVEIECSAANIPENLLLDISGLHLNDSLTAGDISSLPTGVKLLSDPTLVLVHCVPPAAEPEPEDVVAEAGEPEVIGAKPEDEEGQAESKDD